MTIEELRDLNCDAAALRVDWRDHPQGFPHKKDMELLWEAIEKITNHLIAEALTKEKK